MLLFITNREIIHKKGIETIRVDGREYAGDNLRFGEFDSSNDTFSLYPEPSYTNEISYKHLGDAEKLNGSARFFKTLYEAISESKKQTGGRKADVLFFIHGFNTNLADVIDTYKDLERCYVADENSPIAHIVIFTWPSISPKLGVPIPFYTYRDDKQDANRSGVALARAVVKLKDFYQSFFDAKNRFCGQKIHLMVHSMGHQVLASMLIELGNPLDELFGEILLIAADIEYSAFEKAQPFHNLLDLGERIHIYYRETDFILDVSKVTKNWNNRLGRYGRRQKDILSDIYDIDVTNTKDDAEYKKKLEEWANHWYYYSSAEVVNDIIEVLKGGKSKFLV